MDAAGGEDLEILGADVAGQCLQRGLVDEILVYVLPILAGAKGAFRTFRSVAKGSEGLRSGALRISSRS